MITKKISNKIKLNNNVLLSNFFIILKNIAPIMEVITMGMPISSYSVLKAIVKKSRDYREKAARNALEPFNLFAFIIHDPEIHKDFHDFLKTNFDKLDYVSGYKLLFFAIVDPPKEWLEHGSQENYYKQFSKLNYESLKLLDPNNAPNSKDPSITAFAMANYLNIPFDDLPCIVVTSNFELKSLVWFKTSKELLENQLSSLGYFAERNNFSKINFIKELKGINQSIIIHCNYLTSSLAKALTEILDLVIYHSGFRGYFGFNILDDIQQTLEDLYYNIINIKNSNLKEPSEELDRLCILLVSFLSLSNIHNEFSVDDFLNIPKEYLEPDSFNILKTLRIVYNALKDRNFIDFLNLETFELDYTPGVICLSKIFEKEVNLSVVHWARKELGINLPPFYNKYQPGINATITPDLPNAYPIDLNMERKGKWLPPLLGQSELACLKLSKKSLPEGWDQNNWLKLFDIWKTIRTIRNKAAHSEIINKYFFEKTKNTMQEFAEKGYFEKFYNMKRKYSGRE